MHDKNEETLEMLAARAEKANARKELDREMHRLGKGRDESSGEPFLPSDLRGGDVDPTLKE